MADSKIKMTMTSFYIEMTLPRTRKVYIVDANMAHVEKSGGGDYKLIVDESMPRIEIPFKRIREFVFYLSTTVMTQDMLADIKGDTRVMVRSMGPRDKGMVFMNATIIPAKCTEERVAVQSCSDGTVSMHPPEEVMIRDGGPISTTDPIYQRWVREYREQCIKPRGASEARMEEEEVSTHSVESMEHAHFLRNSYT